MFAFGVDMLYVSHRYTVSPFIGKQNDCAEMMAAVVKAIRVLYKHMSRNTCLSCNGADRMDRLFDNLFSHTIDLLYEFARDRYFSNQKAPGSPADDEDTRKQMLRNLRDARGFLEHARMWGETQDSFMRFLREFEVVCCQLMQLNLPPLLDHDEEWSLLRQFIVYVPPDDFLDEFRYTRRPREE